jgi:flagellar biosynthetic protein FliR
MPWQTANLDVAVFLLALVRVGAVLALLPALGGVHVSRRLRALLAMALTVGLLPAISSHAQPAPQTNGGMLLALGGELITGAGMGVALAMLFAAAHWAGELIGQQMGLSLGEMFDPQNGAHGSLLGQAYFLVTIVIFFAVGGHRALVQSLAASFEKLPLMSFASPSQLVNLLAGMLGSATQLAIQLAAPTFITMLIVDLVLGMLSKTIPQLNLMSVGTPVRAAVGLIVLAAGFALSVGVIRGAISDSFSAVESAWTTVSTR